MDTLEDKVKPLVREMLEPISLDDVEYFSVRYSRLKEQYDMEVEKTKQSNERIADWIAFEMYLIYGYELIVKPK